MTKLTDEDRAVFERVREAHPEPIELKRDEAKRLIDAGRVIQHEAGGRGKKGTFRLSDAYAWAAKGDGKKEAGAASETLAAGPGHNLAPEITYNDLRQIIAELNDDKHEIDEATGRYRSAIKRVLDDREWNKGAFGDILKIARMSETARADYLRSFLMLLQVMLDGKWNSELVDMVDQMEEASGGGGEDAPPTRDDPDAAEFDDEGKGSAEAIGEGGEVPEEEDDGPDTFGDQLEREEEPEPAA